MCPVTDPSANLSSIAEATDDFPAQAKKLNWTLPLAKDTHQTYIDHDCTMDSQGYPILPNRSTKFVLQPGDKFENFGNPPCPGSAGACKGKVQWKKCETSMRVDYENPPAENAPEGKLTGWALMRHDGFHNHPWPVPKKLDTVSMHALAAVVLKNPKAGALQLKMGTPNTDPNGAIPQQPFESVVDIHPALLNTDRVRHYRREILRNSNMLPGKQGGGMGDKFIHDMFDWEEKGLNIVSASLRKGQEHFTFQTDWMARRLLDRCEEGNKLYSGGLLSDVTYRFFDTGYLLTTSMYCQTIQRWIPVQLSWIRGLSAKYYEMHFSVLFRQFLDPSISESEREAITLSVLDFSAAQRSGYIAAYVNVFKKATTKTAADQLKGCQEHFRQSVTRIKRNRLVIMADEVVS
ncbi:hypothetical protein PSTG_09765 [Puccinia striiformis f. sp. tritici PST-78]|uniref:GCM domain-containing protein n=1 Tax=Puccinia striiformis f. sp. tritici PST-78 TaxID=1165861 RepID=A0A0L0VCN7_9BASI|nr:hypothetical protein PSTG_09765 [Puccinia striiformis f. sp. tritici PST-78]